jgi:hypothetical protein
MDIKGILTFIFGIISLALFVGTGATIFSNIVMSLYPNEGMSEYSLGILIGMAIGLAIWLLLVNFIKQNTTLIKDVYE